MPRLKPHAAVYHMAARECGVEPRGALVAAHSRTSPGRCGPAAPPPSSPGRMVVDSLFEPPDIVGNDIATVAARTLAVDV